MLYQLKHNQIFIKLSFVENNDTFELEGFNFIPVE